MTDHDHTSLAPIYDSEVSVVANDVMLKGRLSVPDLAAGIVIFAHGSGSSRHSPRNWYVAEVLHTHHIATLLIDLLTDEEEIIDEQTRHLRFDIPMLASRLASVARWTRENDETAHLKIGYFGASTGGGAALIAAARDPGLIEAVVSRGGRPDLAGDNLPQVKAPTLLIVGQRDPQVLVLNENALRRLNDRSKLYVIPGATHLFEEAGALEKVAHTAAEWFGHLLR